MNVTSMANIRYLRLARKRRKSRPGVIFIDAARAHRIADISIRLRMSVDHVNVRTDKPYVDALVAFFRARERRMRH